MNLGKSQPSGPCDPAPVSDGRGRLEPTVGGAGAGGCLREAPLPCLYSNNVIGDEAKTKAVCGLAALLSPYHKRQAHALFDNVHRLISRAPSIGHIGFLTLTTPDNCRDAAEFRRRWRSFTSNFFADCPEFGDWIAVYERQRRGSWHLHLLVIVAQDIRSGVDWAEFERGIYRSASPYLRSLWALLRGRCAAFGFGRHELLPVRSNPEAMARYVGKYIGKHMGQRKPEDKGKRLISASTGWPRSSTRFAWHTEGAQIWRRNLGRLAAHLGLPDMSSFCDRYGSSWAYHLAEVIRDVDQVLTIGPARLDRMLRERCRVSSF